MGRHKLPADRLKVNSRLRQRRYVERKRQRLAEKQLNILAPQSSSDDDAVPVPIPAQAAPIDLPMEWDRQVDSSGMDTSDSEDDEADDLPPLKHDLGVIARESGWTQNSINRLMETLRARGLDLPKDARTILGRDLVYDITYNGTFLYVGVANALDEVLGHHPDFENDTITCILILTAYPSGTDLAKDLIPFS